jgi:hypothetical protein
MNKIIYIKYGVYTTKCKVKIIHFHNQNRMVFTIKLSAGLMIFLKEALQKLFIIEINKYKISFLLKLYQFKCPMLFQILPWSLTKE